MFSHLSWLILINFFDKNASHLPLHYWLDAEKDSLNGHYCHCLQTGSLFYIAKKKPVDLTERNSQLHFRYFTGNDQSNTCRALG